MYFCSLVICYQGKIRKNKNIFLILLKNIDPIEYGDNYFKILYALQKLLQRDVDLVAEETLTNPYFIKVMNKTKTTIYE